jgi:hypothetical protein
VEELPGLQGPAMAVTASAARTRVLRIIPSVMIGVDNLDKKSVCVPGFEAKENDAKSRVYGRREGEDKYRKARRTTQRLYHAYCNRAFLF